MNMRSMINAMPLPYYDAEGGGGGGEFTPAEAPWSAVQGAWMLGEGDKARPWYDAIPEPEVRELIKTKNYANPREIGLAYYNLNKLQRGADDVIALPGKDAKPEDWNNVYTKLGRPANAEAYDLKFDPNVKMDENTVKFGKELAFSLGLNPTQAQTMANQWNQFVSKAYTDKEAKDSSDNIAAMKALETKWGPNLEANKQQGMAVVKALGNEAAQLIERVEGQIGSAAVVELLALIGKKTGEGGLGPTPPPGGDLNDPTNMSPVQAEKRAQELFADADFMRKYTDKANPGHLAAVDTMLKLQSKAALKVT